LGEKKVLTVKWQTLRCEFETLAMKEKESIQEFLARVSGVVSQMKPYRENLSNETIVSKVLRSLRTLIMLLLRLKNLMIFLSIVLMS